MICKFAFAAVSHTSGGFKGSTHGEHPPFFAVTGVCPLIFAKTGHLTVCGHPGTSPFLLIKCLFPPY